MQHNWTRNKIRGKGSNPLGSVSAPFVATWGGNYSRVLLEGEEEMQLSFLAQLVVLAYEQMSDVTTYIMDSYRIYPERCKKHPQCISLVLQCILLVWTRSIVFETFNFLIEQVSVM